MIPLPEDIKVKILGWLPHEFNDIEYMLKETDNIIPDLIAPAITYYFSSAGNPSRESNTITRTVRNEDGSLDDFWGEWKFCTLNVVLRHTDKDMLAAIWREFLHQIEATRRDLNLKMDFVRYIGVLNSIPLDPARLNNGKTLFWAQVDLRFEYEDSRVSDADLIKRVHTHLQVGRENRYSDYYFDEPNS